MKMSVLLDSHGWIEYFAEGPKASKYAKYVEAANPADYVTPSIILYEVYKRIKSVRGESVALKSIAHIIGNTRQISIGGKTALNAAEISMKTKLPMADALIKAVAEEQSAKIITGDSHFAGMKGVVFIE
ncbi:MAG: type II toxin-antitoxin system VapC family toxin [Candidatus Aenigmarchaeota archaeon]|nr:type II toxin-antitoxin system VapC family toxin [Candidatus Aenigmarchaeota archaeon]